jgi:methylation protein EvaC
MNQTDNVHTCSFCSSRRMACVMDFGKVALAGGFLKQEQFVEEQTYRLRLYYCQDCYAVQIVDKISPEILFKNYFYFSSSINTLRKHFRNYAEEVTRRFLNPSSATVLEFGCNDGVLLRPLADQGIKKVIGVDPAENILSSIDDSRVILVNDFFNEKTADMIVAEYGKVDLIMANNVYAHISDIQGTTRAIHNTLSAEGVFIFEVHYLGNVIEGMQYDMIYHEHLYYYSLLSAIKHFERYGMMVFDIQPIPIHAGSMRFYVCKNGSRHSASSSERLKAIEKEERVKGYDRLETFGRFSEKVQAHRDHLLTVLNSLKKSGHRIAGYGASGRANTLIQFCGISHDHLDYIVDDAPAKAGFYTPGSHFRICPSTALSETDAPRYLLLFAWSFFQEIGKRNEDFLKRGGRMILPLPEVKIYPDSDYL